MLKKSGQPSQPMEEEDVISPFDMFFGDMSDGDEECYHGDDLKGANYQSSDVRNAMELAPYINSSPQRSQPIDIPVTEIRDVEEELYNTTPKTTDVARFFGNHHLRSSQERAKTGSPPQEKSMTPEHRRRKLGGI